MMVPPNSGVQARSPAMMNQNMSRMRQAAPNMVCRQHPLSFA